MKERRISLIALMLIALIFFGFIGCSKQEPNDRKNSDREKAILVHAEDTEKPLNNSSDVVEIEYPKEESATVVSTEEQEDVELATKKETAHKQDESASTIDIREKVTMVDKNTIYMDNTIYYKNIPTVEDYIASHSVQKKTIANEYAELEKSLLVAIQGSDVTFIHSLPNNVSSFVNDFITNHMTYGNCVARLSYSCHSQNDGTYIFTVNLVDTRKNIADTQAKWNDQIATQKKYINELISHNDEFNRQNAIYKEKVNQCVVAAGIKEGMTVEDAIVKIDAYIRKINTYDDSGNYYHFSDVFNYGKSVCNGYATLFFLMAQRCGIDCEMVSSAKMNHIWNVVHYDGKDRFVDVTWNDCLGNSKYLLVTKEQLSKTHNFSDVVTKSKTHIVYQ